MEEAISDDSLSRKLLSRNPCSVCGGPGYGLHFGAEACKACAAFFRRSIACEKSYICRVEGACEVSSNARTFCRACRLQKCLSAGMKKISVQRYRQNVSKLNKNEEFDCPVPDEEIEIKNLNRLKDNYQRVDQIRRKIHGRTCENVFQKHNPRQINYREATAINVKEVDLVADFVVRSFPQLAVLPIEQQKLLYKRFFLYFLLLESGYHCSVTNRSDIIIMPTGDHIDMTHPETFYQNEEHSQLMTGRDAVQTLSPSFDLFKRNILEPMRVLQVDEMEFLTLCSFSFWDHGIDDQTNDCENLVNRIRKEMARELIFYYKHLKKIYEPAERLSAIMMLLTPLQRAVQRFQQDVEISHFFSYDFDDKFYKIVSGKY